MCVCVCQVDGTFQSMRNSAHKRVPAPPRRPGRAAEPFLQGSLNQAGFSLMMMRGTGNMHIAFQSADVRVADVRGRRKVRKDESAEAFITLFALCFLTFCVVRGTAPTGRCISIRVCVCVCVCVCLSHTDSSVQWRHAKCRSTGITTLILCTVRTITATAYTVAATSAPGRR